MDVLTAQLKAAGISRKELADRLGVHYSAVSNWCNGYMRITAERAKQIEQVTHGQIPKELLRPDVFA